MATQTGSIDLRGANSAKLYVDDEAGEIRTEVSETYATKTEVRRTNSGTGTVITSDDAANLPPLSLTIHGKSVQDGTPTPSAPVPIRSVEGENLYDPTKAVSGYLTTTGTITGATTNNEMTSDFILIGGGNVVTVLYEVDNRAVHQPWVCVQWFKADKTFGGQLARNIVAWDRQWMRFIIPTDGVYVRVAARHLSSGYGTLAVKLGYSSFYMSDYGSIGIVSSNANVADPSNIFDSYMASTSSAPYSYGSRSTTNLEQTMGFIPLEGTEKISFSVDGCTSDMTQSSTGGWMRLLFMDDNGNKVSGYDLGARDQYTYTASTIKLNSPRDVPAGATSVSISFRTYGGTPCIRLDGNSEFVEYQGTKTPIDLQGHALRSLPDGTQDVLEVDGEGNVTLTQRIGLTTTATTDGITATVGTDAMSTTGTLADGATVIYKLATTQTISLGKIDLPSLPSPSFSAHVDAAVTPTLDAEWWTQGGEEVGSVYQRTSALEQDVDGITLELSEKVDSSEEWVSWLHAGTDATTHEPYLAMGKDSDYPSVVYSTDAARFYDGEGDDESNVVASFGTEGVVVGKDGSANTTISDSEIVFHDANGNEAGKISMSSAGAVPASASHTITAGDAQQTYTLEGLTPLPDFTLGYLVVNLFYNGTLNNRYRYTSIAEAEFTVSIDTYNDATFTAAQSGDTWGATMTAQHRVVGETADFTFSLEWVYLGTAPIYEFGTTENTGAYSFSAGTGLVAAGQSQAVFGKYNKPSETDLFILGNGTSDGNRSNALKVDSQGTLETSGYFQSGGVVGLGTEAQQGWLTALGPFMRFAEVTTATQSISSGSVGYFSVAAPTYTGYTLRGAIQSWASGSGTVIIGASYRSSADNNMHFVVRANNTASVAVKALLLYTLDAITS